MKKYLEHVTDTMNMMEEIHSEKKPSVISCEVITDDMPLVKTQRATGWGDKAISTTLDSMPMKFTVIKNGKPMFSIRISDNGALKITNYEGHYEQSLVNNIDLEPTVPWTK